MRRFPAEWERHDATWMCFPRSTYGSPVSLDEARNAWAAVAMAISAFEPVNMLVDPADHVAAEDLLGDVVNLIAEPLDDAWARDIGPTYTTDDGNLVAVDWTFNGWGAQDWASWTHDRHAARAMGRASNASIDASTMVAEGGGIETNGAGLLVTTETVLLDPGRNPGWSRSAIEVELERRLGIDRTIWVPRGLAGDYGDYSTRGHIDLVVKFIDEETALVHDQRNEAHPDAGIFATVAPLLEAAGITTVPIVAPRVTEVDGRICDWSYINCYPVNGGLVVGTYDDPADEAAIEVLEAAFPGRTISSVDARTLFALGGGVHCITQQQPTVEA